MRRTSVILLGVIVGLYCGFCHAEAVGAKEYHEIEIVEPIDVDEALDTAFREWRAHRIELIAWLIMRENGVVDHPTVFPINMFYFREGDFHHWEGVEDYLIIDGTCFSTEGEPIWE